jgi:hypothetical protein
MSTKGTHTLFSPKVTHKLLSLKTTQIFDVAEGDAHPLVTFGDSSFFI